MGRGLLAGTFWGLLIGAFIIVMASQVSTRQKLSFPQPDAAPVDVPGGTEFNQARPETDPVTPGAVEPRPSEQTVVSPAVPEAESAPLSVDTATLDQPIRSEAAPAEPDTPTALEPADAPSATVEALPETDPAPAIAVPSSDAAPVEPTPAAQAPERTTTLETPAPAPEPAPEAAPESARPAPSAPSSPSAPSLPSADVALPSPAQAPDAPARPTIEAAVSAPETNIEIGESPSAPSDASLDAAPSIAATTPSVSAPNAPDTPPQEIASLPEAEPTLPAQPAPEAPAKAPDDLPAPAGVPVQDSVVQAPAPPTTETAALPRVFRPESSPLPSAATNESDEAATEEGEVDPRAIYANAIEFEADPDASLIALVLVHSGNLPPSQDQLDVLPAEIAFAVPADLPAARTIAQTYRDAGREVVAIPDLASGAQADAIVAAFDQVPGAVAIMDSPETGFGSDRNTIASLIAATSASGHGVITYPRGFNSTQQAAEREGVPARLVFRSLDAAAQSDEAIRRQLDQATFRARQDRSVILTVRSDLSSVTAVVEWALANRTGQVALAPVSAALLVE